MPRKREEDGFFERIIDRIAGAVEDMAEEVVETVVNEVHNLAARQRVIPTNTPATRRKRPTVSRKRNTPSTPPKPPVHTAYDILGVTPDCDQEALIGAFKSLSRKYHPDNGETGNNERYKKLTAAWAEVKTVEKRREYDRKVGIKK